MISGNRRVAKFVIWVIVLGLAVLLMQAIFYVRAQQDVDSTELLERLEALEVQVEELEYKAQVNFTGDCIIQNILRIMGRAPDLLSYEECWEQRERWFADELERQQEQNTQWRSSGQLSIR